MKKIFFILIVIVSNVIDLRAQCTLPVITTQPVSVTVCEGSPVSLRVQATDATSYQWYWTGSSGSSGNGIVPPISPPWSGTTANILTLAPTSISMGGKYWVKVTNACGTVTSNVVDVTVVQTGTATFPEYALSVANNGLMCPGSTINFSGPSNLPNYSWTGPNNFTSNVRNPSIANATTSMTGVYTLTSSNGKGCVNTGSISVVFNSSPTVNSQPANVTVCDGAQTALTINATGNGNTYQWYWSGSASGGGIVPPLSPPWSGQQTKTLTLSPTAPAMAGQYWVKITNACGTITSSAANVIVDKPTVTLTSNPSVVCAGGAFTFQAMPNGMSAYSWSGPNGFTSTKQNPSVSSAVSGSYTLTVTTANGCAASATAVIDAKQVTPTIAISSNPDWCADGKAVLTATITNGGSSPSYQWFVDGVAVASATGNTYVSSVLNNEKISCTLTSNAVCAISTKAVSSVITISRCETNSMNYVRSRSVLKDNVFAAAALEELSVEDLQESTTYFDGLGRPVQTVSWQSSPSHKDMIQPIEYDIFGREKKKYLPYAAENNGRYKDASTNVSGNYTGSPQNTFYTNNSSVDVADDIAPYAETVFESSPLNRIIKQGAPGAVWQPDAANAYSSSDRTIKKSYESNLDNEVLLWTYLDPTSTYPLGLVNAGTSASRVYYAANELYKNRTKDEHGNEIIEYADKEGHTILKRVQVVKNATVINDVNYASTYYIYDDLGSLVTVIPPEAVKRITSTTPSAYFDQTDAVKETFLQQWAFRYIYDWRKRMTQKQVPGAACIYMVYDDRDRLVLTQDGNQRANMQWTFTKYDELNRPIATGIIDTTAAFTPAEMQLGVNNHYAKSWAKYGETYIGAADKNVHGYSNFSYPTVTTAKIVDPNRYLTVTYYDNYTFKSQYGSGYNYVNDGLKEAVNGCLYEQRSSEFTSVIGQVTGTKVKVLDGGITGGYTWLRSVNYYDDKYRVIQTISDNYKEGTDRTSILYDFVGKTLQTKSLHTENDILWTDLVASYFSGNILKSTSASSTWGLSGAASVQTLAAGQDGWIEFMATEGNTYRMIGLSSQNTNAHYNTIGYALYLKNNGIVAVYEGGNPKKDVGIYSPGDIFRIQRIGTAIKYFRNGQEIYPAGQTVTQASSNSPLLVDIGFYALSSVAGVRASFANSSHTILRRYVYDHAGRLMETYHTLGNGPEVLLASNEYNELGQLIDKGLHSVNGSAPMQSVDYRYNIRGWLTSMNNSQLSSDGQTNDDAGDFFGMNLAYNEELCTGNTQSTFTNTGLVSSYTFSGNASDAVANGLNGVVYGAQLTTDSQGNSNSAYNFTASDYIDIPNSKDKHSFIQNTGVFTISAFVKIDDLNGRNVIVSSTSTSLAKGFTLMYETYGGIYGDHQLRFSATNGQSGQVVIALGGVRTINDNNWHHVAAVGDGKYVTLYVDGLQDGSPTPVTIFASGSATSTTLIGKTRSNTNTLSLGMVGGIDELNIFNRPMSKSEIGALAKRIPFNTILDDGQYNGNISAMKWSINQGRGNTKEMAYNFKYDALNRLTSADNLQSSSLGVWNKGKYHERDLTYDLNGNIKSLTRSSELGMIDNLVYSYGSGTTQSNKLLSVTDKTTDTVVKLKGFTDSNTSGNDYTYDVNGNMTIDQNKGLSSPITYNYLNLPEVVTRNVNSIRYIYDATGRKLSQVVRTGYGVKQMDYAGEFIYEDDMLQFINHEEGRIVMSSEKLLYTHDGASTTGLTAFNTTLAQITQNGETYVRATSNGSVLNSGIFPIGNTLSVTAGEKYMIRAKGYRTGSYNVVIQVKTDLMSSVGYGSYLPASAATDSWVEYIYTVPKNTTQLQVGIGWGTVATGQQFFLNDFEVKRIESATPEYQYNLKDHLGNVRLTFTTKIEEDIYTATFEDGTQADETNNFKNYSRVTSDMFDHTDAGTVYTKAQMLNGSSGSQVGLAKTLSVMPGDVIKAKVYAKYFGAKGGSTDLSTFGAALLSAFNLSAPLAGETGTARAALQDYGTFIAGNGNPGNEDSPKGWLNILVFDRDHNLVDLAFEQLSSAYVQQLGSVTKTAHQLLSKEVTIKEPGYVYIYVSNEGHIAQEIYFDDLMISHKKSQVIQSNDYYPFGLTFNSNQRENSIINAYQYNGKEQQDELSIGWLDYGARMYIPETGRFNRTDKAAGIFLSSTPYSFALNSPVNAVDPDGNYVIFVNGLTNLFGWHFMSPGADYWNPKIVNIFRKLFNRSENAEFSEFVNGEFKVFTGSALSTASERFNSGKEWAKENYNRIIQAYECEKETNPAATLNIVSHSQGGAFAEGIAAYIAEHSNGAYKVNTAIHLQPSASVFITADRNTVDTRLAVYTQDDLVANKSETRMENVDVEIYEKRAKHGKIDHVIKVRGEFYNEIRYRGSYSVFSAHALNWLRYNQLLNSISVGFNANQKSKTASIYHPHKFDKDY